MVESRSRTHLHSIRTIIDGSIKTVVNVVARGKPKLKFRKLVDIYSVSDMTQGSCLFGAEVSDPEGFNMTLWKIRKQCEEEKRKLGNRGDIETASHVEVKQESLTLETEDEGFDFDEPLSNWKTKLSKKRKSKQEFKTKCNYSSPSTENDDLPILCDVKREACDDNSSVTEAVELIFTNPLVDCNKEPQSSEPETIVCIKNLIDSVTISGGEEVKEDEPSNGTKSNLDMTVSVLETVKIEGPEILADLDMTVTGLDFVKIEVTEIPATDYSGIPTMDFGVEITDTVWDSEDISTDEVKGETDILQLTGCCTPLDDLNSVPDDSTISVEGYHRPERLQQSSSSANVDEAGDHKLPQLFQAPTDIKTAGETDSIQQQSGRKVCLVCNFRKPQFI